MLITTQSPFIKRVAPLAAGLFVLTGGLIILVGWVSGLKPLVSPFDAGVSRFNTAVMFVLLGISLLNFHHAGRLWSNLLQLVTVSLLLFMASITLFQYLADRSFGIDEFFYTDWMPAEQGKYPGRPSPATTLCFLALALALIIRSIAQILMAVDTDTDAKPLTPRLSRLLAFNLALYASLVLATGITVALSLLVWITGSAESIFGRMSSGQSFQTSLLFLVATLGMILSLMANRPFEVRFYWLPQSVFVAFLVLGLVIAHNTHDNRLRYFEQEEDAHIRLIRQLAFAQLDDAITNLTYLSWYSGNPLTQINGKDAHQYRGLIGITFEKQNHRVDHFGEEVRAPLPNCKLTPYHLNWVGDDLLISVQATTGNPGHDLCIHGLYDKKTFISSPWRDLNLKFDTDLVLLGERELALENPVLTLAGKRFLIELEPTLKTVNQLGQDSRLFLISLSAFFGLIAAIAVNMLLKSRHHNQEIIKANHRLSQLEARNRRVLEMAPEAVVLVDGNGTIIYANRRTIEIFGYKPDELQFKPLEILLPEKQRGLHRSHRGRYMKDPVTREMGMNLPLEALHADGTTFPVDIVLSPIEFDDERVVMAIVRDISYKKAEKIRIERDLQEKTILLKEVYHRVKNNMQVIASLLKMQSRSADHPQTKVSLNEAALRISALALVHEKLYQSEDLSRASIKSYIESLAETLRQTYVGDTRLSIQIHAKDEEFEPEVIVPIGLILNELISNAMKHAFGKMKSQSAASIRVYFVPKEDESYLLSVEDNGSGLPEGCDIEKHKSLGLKLIKSLTAQLKGHLSVYSDENGCRFEVRIPNKSLQPTASPMVTGGLSGSMPRTEQEQ